MRPAKAKAVTLLELVISLFLISVIVLTVSSVATSVYKMKKDVLDKQQAVVQGTLATAVIFERVLRAALTTSGSAFRILDNGKRLEYRRISSQGSGGTIAEAIWWQPYNATDPKSIGKINYHDGTTGKVILFDVKRLNFVQDFGTRLAADVTLCLDKSCSSTQNFRTAVQPRSAPGNPIN